MNMLRHACWAIIACVLFTSQVFADSDPIALWASGSNDDAIDWSGSTNTVDGMVHSNGGIKLVGSDNTVNGATYWVTKFENGGGNNTFIPSPIQTQISHFPFQHNISDYQPGGRAALAAGSQYFNESATCNQNGKWERDVQGTDLAPGLYWVPCDVVFNASNLSGQITIVSTGKVEVSGSDQSDLSSFIDGVLFLTARAERSQ